jgi:hypothetical protein
MGSSYEWLMSLYIVINENKVEVQKLNTIGVVNALLFLPPPRYSRCLLLEHARCDKAL